MYDINTLKINDGDSLIVNFNESLDIDECQSVLQYLNESFPNNKIIGIPFGVIDKITILNKTNNNDYPF